MQSNSSNRRRYSASLLAFAVFCLLAAGSAEESSEEKKARVVKSEGVSESIYDSRVKEFGTYDDYKAASEKKMTAEQYSKYKSQRDACRENWYSCADNAQLANEWSGWSKVAVSCERSAEDLAKYGDPEWPWLAFSHFRGGEDYAKTGKVVAIEPDAKFKNGFNASVRVRVVCYYDLKANRVEDVSITER
jgi:hypothetical protein